VTQRRDAGSQADDLIEGASWISDDDGLEALIDRVLDAGDYAIDTEFHRERSYFPKLALVQIGLPDEISLVDPLAVDPARLGRLFSGDGCAVFHAAQQDLDVLWQACGAMPLRIYDTQLAAGFLGHTSPSLVSLVSGLLKTHVPKGDRLTDWLRRPLSAAQRRYAASDVAHLFAIRAILDDELGRLGRVEWVRDACEELRRRPVGPPDPEIAWLRVKDVRTLRGRSRWVARALAKWRESRAMELDIPARHVLSDLSLLGVAQRCPRSVDELSQSRGIDARAAGGSLGRALLAAVEQGLEESSAGELAFPSSEADDLDRSLRPAVTLVSAWLTELARRERLDPALLGTRADIVDLLRRAPGARLATGWRADIAGRDVEDMVSGRAALTFVPGGGGLRLVPVADEPRGARSAGD
jgi:ribonuclease D